MNSVLMKKKKFRVKLYRKRKEILVAACDTELLGKVLREGEVKLDVSSSFYGGEEAETEVLIERLKAATIGNLVGERTVKLAIDNGFVDRDSVLKIGGVPHAQFVRM